MISSKNTTKKNKRIVYEFIEAAFNNHHLLKEAKTSVQEVKKDD